MIRHARPKGDRTAIAPPRTDGISGFSERLVEIGIVSRTMLDDAVRLKRTLPDHDRRQLFQLLIDEFGTDREVVYAEFAKYYSFKTIDLHTVEMTVDRLTFISRTLELLSPRMRDMALTGKILPFRISPDDQAKIQLITPDPINPNIATLGRALPFPRYEVCYVALAGYEELSRELLVETQGRPSGTTVEYIDEEQDTLAEELDEEIRRGHLAELVDGLFVDAVRVNASDIHVVPRTGRRTEVFFRIDGRLTLWQAIEDLRADAVAAVIKDMSKGPDRFERNMAQDGFVQKILDGKIVRFRVSIIPVIGRELKVKLESIVIRVLRDPEASITIENIGFEKESLRRFRLAIEQPHGIVILTGPTGSGKSTTLLAALRAVMNPALNIITVEDPVEYFIDGSRQVKLNPKLDFEEALRAILRHDPDIVMVGEIRDRITADLAVKLSNTGHLTFTTLHTNDAPSAIARLYKMGVETFLLAYAINIIVAQRLLRKLCQRCKVVDAEVPAVTLKKLGIDPAAAASMTFYKPTGCIHCLRGYRGRTAIHEVLYFTNTIRKMVMDSTGSIDEDAIRRVATAEGMKTLRDSALELLRQGVTSVEEVVATTMTSELYGGEG